MVRRGLRVEKVRGKQRKRQSEGGVVGGIGGRGRGGGKEQIKA